MYHLVYISLTEKFSDVDSFEIMEAFSMVSKEIFRNIIMNEYVR